jgi:non-ribosomal peptide synthetase component F
MRTTLDIEDDVLQAAKEMAARERSTAGGVLSRLARAGLNRTASKAGKQRTVRNGVPVFSARPGEIVTLEHVQKLMDEEGV